MDTTDEIPLEDHYYFLARLDHLESRHPVVLLGYLEMGTLTEHLRDVTVRAMKAKGNLVIHQDMPDHQADEMVMQQVVADPLEPMSLLQDRASLNKLRSLLVAFKMAMPHLQRTYLSQNETTA